MYVYLRKTGRKHALAPIRLINKTQNIPPISMEKFHNELQIAIRKNELQFLRLIKAIPGDMWVLESDKTIQTAYDEVLDLKIPFDLLDVKSGETLEFIFINANFGVKDFYIPNEMVLSVTRPAMVLKSRFRGCQCWLLPLVMTIILRVTFTPKLHLFQPFAE